MEQNDYFLGLDMGTSSVGWAVTDQNYNIIKKSGKALWGSRIFETANTAKERRTYRVARRRLERRKQRIALLQEIFAEEINKVDPGFYLRLKESRYLPMDKRDLKGNIPELPYALFMDKDFTDKEYHMQYPTIYHLRKALIISDEVFDVRLVYLAIHHMMKNRGHFLMEGKNTESIKNFALVYDNMLQILSEQEITLAVDNNAYAEIENVLKNGKLTKTEKKNQLTQLMNATNKQQKAIANLLAGGTVKLSDIFDDESFDQAERTKLSFSDKGYDEYATEIEETLRDRYIVIEAVKALYDWSVLADLLGNYTYFSEAKAATYDKHQADLILLKSILKEYPEEYKKVFGEPKNKIANYSAYIGSVKKNGKKVVIEKNCSKEEFYDFLKKELSTIKDNRVVQILQMIDIGNFLPRQVVKDNSVVPYQLNYMELDVILNHAMKYLPFLSEVDEDGYCNADKIREIMKFKIPYYVGPVNTSHLKESGGYCWAVRKDSGRIYPWNIQDKIDMAASAEAFIRRMTNKCTYLIDEDVLPKESLLYSKFAVLNELNNLRINGEIISVELKQWIYHEIFEHTKKVTGKKLRTILLKEGKISKTDEITGIDGDFKSSLKSYHDLKELLTGSNLSMTEKEHIISDISLFHADKKLLRSRLKQQFPQLSEGQIKRLSELSYEGWGRLSRTFLEEVTAPSPETGEVWNIITAMWETNDNLMQVLSQKYLFLQEIEDRNKLKMKSENMTYQSIDKLYVSPSVKRPIWQTIEIVKEIQKIMGASPKRVFIEVAREKQESRRTVSRKKILQDLYAQCKKEERNWKDELQNTDENKFRSDRLYLYYTQKGRCMYSGEPIDLEDLYNDNLYDIDHIYPQSKVMDDSLDNRVLVKKQLNAEKTDEYPIKREIRENCKNLWQILLESGFISKEKYYRLTRADGFTDSELAGFIARQLVETRQSTKAVANILKQALPKTDIVYSKANAVSNFRQQFDLIKVREMNDLHHAKDAYLNIVVGNAYFVKFTKDAVWYIQHSSNRSYNLKKMFVQTDIERNGEIAWKAGAGGTIKTVKATMKKNNIFFTRRAYEVKGGLFDQQLVKKGNGQIAVKGTDERLADINKYGGYNSVTGAYFMLVESNGKKGEKIRTIEFVPIYLSTIFEKDENAILKYCQQNLGLKEPRILIKKIKKDALFKINGYYMHLSGRKDVRLLFKNATQLIIDDKQKELKEVIKFNLRLKTNKNTVIFDNDKISELKLKELYDCFLDKLKNTIYKVGYEAQIRKLEDNREAFCNLSIENKCIVLNEILHLFQCNSLSANLSLINEKNADIKAFSKNVKQYNQISIVNQSITGFYSQEIDLKTIL